MPPKYYAVQSGRETGVFSSWEEVRALVSGYTGAVHKSFSSYEAAASFASGSGGYTRSRLSSSLLVSAPRAQRRRTQSPERSPDNKWAADSSSRYIVVTDGASRGNPGLAGSGAAILDLDGNAVVAATRFLFTATNLYLLLCLRLRVRKTENRSVLSVFVPSITADTAAVWVPRGSSDSGKRSRFDWGMPAGGSVAFCLAVGAARPCSSQPFCSACFKSLFLRALLLKCTCLILIVAMLKYWAR